MSVLGLFGFLLGNQRLAQSIQIERALVRSDFDSSAITWKSFWSSSQVEDNYFENHLLCGGQADSWPVHENRYKHSRTSVKEVTGRTIVVGKAFRNYGGGAGVHYLQNGS